LSDGLSVLIADDHPPTRAGVKAALERAGFVVASEHADAAAAVQAALDERPDICLLDVHMPGNGITAAARIRAALPETSIVMLTVSTNDTDLFDALRAGALGYLLKDTDPERLPHALRGVLNGEAALPRTLVARLIEEFRGREHRRVSLFKRRGVELTSREWQVLELLRTGLSTGEIAEELVISHVTVRTHVSAILKKLQVPDRKAALELFEES
jgi:DNA-binding NarL/FixJ family response regulator